MIKGVLIDLSGTLHVGHAPIPGAIETISRLQEAGLLVRFVTNTSRKTRHMLHGDLLKMGFTMSEEEIFTGALAVRRYLEQHRLRPYLLVHEQLIEEFEGMETADPDAVVVGYAADSFTYRKMNEAFRLLKGGAQLLATGRTRYFEGPDGLMLDAGAYIAGLEYAAETKALVLGKPSAEFFASAAAEIGLAPSECVMVGDDAESDVAAAIGAGLQGVLVATGKYRKGDEDKVPKEAGFTDSVAAAADRILRLT